jgi:hypothetical protein
MVAAVAVCGLLGEYLIGLDMDFWYKFREADVGKFGAGMMGLYRGAIGAWGIGILGVAGVVLQRRKSDIIMLGFVALSVSIFIAISGSRQGVLIGGCTFALSLWYGAKARTRGRVAEWILPLLITATFALAVLSVSFSTIMETAAGEYLRDRFDTFTGLEKLVDAAVSRNSRMRDVVLQRFAEDPPSLVYGKGFGAYNGPQKSGVIYMDSELMNVLQTGGLITLGCYALVLLALRKRIQKGLTASGKKRWVAAALPPLYGGVLLLWGHFYLLTTFAHQAPIAYWNWALLGGAVGIVAKTTRRQGTTRMAAVPHAGMQGRAGAEPPAHAQRPPGPKPEDDTGGQPPKTEERNDAE